MKHSQHRHRPKSVPAEPVAGTRPTLKSIAFMTGLSVTAVSRALKDAPDISPATKDRVRLAAAQVGYRPNRAGVRLRTGRTNVISLILNTSEQIMGLTSDIINGISEVLKDTGYHLILTPYSHEDDPMTPVRYVVESGSADGIILSRIEPNDPRVHYLSEKGIPFATHGQTMCGIEHPFHDYDNEAFARDSVARLAGLGVRTASLLGAPMHLTYGILLARGFRAGISEHGLKEHVISRINSDDPLDTIERHIEALMRSRDRPDGFVCASGATALPLTCGAEKAGLVIGRDFQLVSKQSADILHHFRPAIRVVNEDFRLAGRDLASAVLASIRGEPAANLQYIVYESTA